MAKSFKQFSSDTVQPVKRTSEKDLLDFLEQDRLTPPTTPEVAVTEVPKADDDQLTGVSHAGSSKPIAGAGNSGNINNTVDATKSIDVATGAARKHVPSEKAAKVPRRETAAAGRVKSNQPDASLASGGAVNVHEVTDVSGVSGVTDVPDVTKIIQEHDVDVRQTFVLSQQYLEKLKNFVHTQRMSGQYDFTQKQALHQALDLLFDNARIEERPLQIRQKEEVRRQQIRKGKGR